MTGIERLPETCSPGSAMDGQTRSSLRVMTSISRMLSASQLSIQVLREARGRRAAGRKVWFTIPNIWP